MSFASDDGQSFIENENIKNKQIKIKKKMFVNNTRSLQRIFVPFTVRENDGDIAAKSSTSVFVYVYILY